MERVFEKIEANKTVRERLKIISDAITENTTLSDLIFCEGIGGQIIINIDPSGYKIKSVDFSKIIIQNK